MSIGFASPPDWLRAEVPASWDETRFIEGAPGEHVIIARRSGDDWFIGGMTAAARTSSTITGSSSGIVTARARRTPSRRSGASPTTSSATSAPTSSNGSSPAIGAQRR